MVADIRALISCDLGEVISGNWSDEPLAFGQGLIRCRGQIIIKGVIVPAAGTKVSLAYVRDGLLAKVPRVLRVLSSFADPLRQTTTVQLGDKLVWLEQKRQGPEEPNTLFPAAPDFGDTFTKELPYPPPEFDTELRLETREFNGVCWKKVIAAPADSYEFDWSNSGVAPWEQNPLRPADEELRAPVTVPAFFVMAKCLAALGLTSTGIPLQSHYEQSEIDLTGGYVAAMEQLLSQESYVGYLDEVERLVIVPATPATPGAGPLISEEDVIDIAPIGSGELPIEDPNVAFREPEPQEPKDPTPSAPVAQNFIGGASYEGATVSIPNGYFTTKAEVDPVMYQLSKLPGLVALYSVSAGIGGTVVQNADGVVFTPEASFNGTATFTYQVTDGQQLSNDATVYIRVSENAATPEETARDLEEQPSEQPAAVGGSSISWEYTADSERQLSLTYTTLASSAPQTATYRWYPGSRSSQVSNNNGNIILSRETQHVGRAEVLGKALQRYLESGGVNSFNGTVDVVTITETKYRPVSTPGTSSTKPEPSVGASVCTINGECPADLDFPATPANGDIHKYGECVYEYNSGSGWGVALSGTPDTEQTPRLTVGDAKRDGYLKEVQEEPVFEVATTWEPAEMAIGALNWEAAGLLPVLSGAPFIGSKTETAYYRDRNSGVTRTVTTRYEAAYKNPQGQQWLAGQIEYFTEDGQIEVSTILGAAKTLQFVGQTSSTRYDPNYGLRPSAPDAVPSATSAETDKIAATGATLTGPTTSTTSPEEREPDVVLDLTPVVPRTWTPEDGYEEAKDAFERINNRVLALRKARAQYAIAYGNRYGMSLQVTPWALPRYPLEPFYLQLVGATAAYRTNGLTVAFDSNGVIANVDGLLTGGVGGTGSPWFPVPPTVTTLPLAPASTANPGAFPLSSIEVPEDFDPAAPGATLDTIPSSDTVTYAVELEPAYIIPPVAPTVTVLRGIRVGLRVQRLDYAIVPLERTVALGVTVGHEVIPDYGDAPEGWTPAALALTAWYDAGTPGDFTLDAGTVSQWNDRSGNAHHMSQSTGSAKPAYASATQNSLNLVTFDGTNDFLTSGTALLSDFISATSFSILVVVRHRATSVGSTDSWVNRAIMADELGYFGLHTRGPTIPEIAIRGYNWDADDDSVEQVVGANNLWSIIIFAHGSGTISIRRNGSTAATAASGSTEDMTGTLEFGKNTLQSLYQEMDLAEVVLLDSSLSGTNQQKLEGYAAHRWGLAAGLPSDHPYKSAAP